MKTKKQMQEEYLKRSEILTLELRRDEIARMAWACENDGNATLARKLWEAVNA